MKALIVLISILLVSCSKDAQTVLDGTYTVNTDDHRGHHLPGTITISGSSFVISGQAWGNHSTQITLNGDIFTINQGGGIKLGSGRVNENEITGYLQVFYPGGVDGFDFNGSK